jgi:3-oxoacyl-[acyl-carrier-protein] synthase II
VRGEVVVTGLGVASALGTGLAAHRDALWAGRHGIRPVDRFDTSALSTRLAATWPGWDGRVQPEPNRDRTLFESAAAFQVHELALVAAREAWSTSGASCEPKRLAVVFGTCFGQGFDEFPAITRRIAAGLDAAGPCITISTACASSTNAIGLARDLVARGHADVAIAGGADALLREGLAGFSALGVLSEEPCAPFSDPPGTTLGEGAAFVVLERAEDAARRSAKTWARICGYGLSADAFHETTPDPSGSGIARAIRGALADAGFTPRDVDFVSAHATGTENNDRIEWSVIERELGAPAVSGSKGHVGHTQGAAGALELALALMCHREGFVPPTLHFRGPRAGCPPDPIAGSAPREMHVSRGVKLSAAFGGANAALAYACTDVPSRAPPARADVFVAGASLVAPSGAARLSGVLDVANGENVGACRDVDLRALGIEPRRLDRSARWMTAAAALALPDKRPAPDRIGLFAAAARMPVESSRKCSQSIRSRGIAGTSASAFARMSVNAPAGACTEALGLLGPTTTMSCGEGSGLLAIALAAEWLAFRDDATTLLAGAVDELADAPGETEGAACLALSRERSAVIVSGWAIEGPGGGASAAARAVGERRVDALVVDGDVAPFKTFLARDAVLGVIDARTLWGVAEAARSCALAAIAVAYVAARRTPSVLVVAPRGASTVAVLFESEGR